MIDHDSRTTAFVLGELDAVETRAFRDSLEREPEAIEHVEAVREIAALMQESLQEPSALVLSDEQRAAILNAIPAPASRHRVSRIPWAAAAAALVVLAAGTSALLRMRDTPTPSPPQSSVARTNPPGVPADPSVYRNSLLGLAAPIGLDGNAEPAPVRRPIIMVGMAGQTLREIAPASLYRSFRLSPDEQHIALEVQSESGQRDIWIRSLATGDVRRLTADGARSPVWSPDGRVVIFSAPRSNSMFQVNRDGGARTAVAGGGDQSAVNLTPDGRTLVWQQRDPATGWDLWMAPISGGAPRALTSSAFAEQNPSISPDGRWIAYTSDETGQSEIFVRELGAGTKYRISPNGAIASRWRANGRELFYIAPGGRLMSVSVASKDDTFSVGAPRMLFQIPAPLAADFEVTRDGERFVLFGDGGDK